jgi:urease accessory protein
MRPVIILEHAPTDWTLDALRGKVRDTLVLSWEERRWGRRRVITTNGRDVALALPTGSQLTEGQILLIAPDWYLQVEAAPEPVLAVFPSDHAEAIRLAFEIGNRHFPLALEPDCLLVPDDIAMEQLFNRLGVKWERRASAFKPLGHHHSHEH